MRKRVFPKSMRDIKIENNTSHKHWGLMHDKPPMIVETVAAKRMYTKHKAEGLTELQHQIRVVAWFDKFCGDYGLPPYALHSVPNGSSLSSAITGKHLNDSGMRKGVEDLFLSVPRNGWHGLYIEMKAQGKGVISDDQKKLAEFHFQQGYQSHVCWGKDEAIEVIQQYLTPSI